MARTQACQLPIIFNFAEEVAWRSTTLKGPRENLVCILLMML